MKNKFLKMAFCWRFGWGVSSLLNAGLIIFSENKDQITQERRVLHLFFSPALSSDGAKDIGNF